MNRFRPFSLIRRSFLANKRRFSETREAPVLYAVTGCYRYGLANGPAQTQSRLSIFVQPPPIWEMSLTHNHVSVFRPVYGVNETGNRNAKSDYLRWRRTCRRIAYWRSITSGGGGNKVRW